VGLYWVHEHAGVQGIEITSELTRGSCALKFVGTGRLTSIGHGGEFLVILRQGYKLISGPCPGAKARFLSFNRTQSRVVTGLLTGPNTLRRHLHLMRLSDSPLCRRCGAEDENLAHILCECEALASLRHVYLGSFFLDPEDIKSVSLGASWNFSKSLPIKA